jgi:molecular chaperone DnaK
VSEVVGIDLGTTNTVVSAFVGGEARALADETGNTLIPSVVSFHPNGTVLVGRTAKDRRVIDPASTVYSVKRLIGRSWDTEEVRRARSRLPFDMREGPGQSTLVYARGESYTLPEISAFVLRKAKSVAEAALGKPVEQAVITVPANFNDLQRAATKVAGRVAGLEVLRILNEPTAAALAYGYGKDSSERVAVYDFGGGTFDVTLLDLSNNVFEVLATAGNTFLGGDDIDIAIAERMAELFLRKHRYDVRTDPVLFDRFRLAAEELKQELSTEESAHVEIEDVMQGDGGKSIDFSFEMSRGELDLSIAAIVDQTFDVCRDALSVARLNVSDLDQVLLVGGSTRIPLVQRRVEEFFRREGRHHLSPDEVVAVGAAIQARALAGSTERRVPMPPAPVAARRASTEPGGVGRGTRPSGSMSPGPAEPGRLRLSSMADAAEVPATKPFEERQPPATRPGVQPHGAPTPAAAEAKIPGSTWVGLGVKGRTRTGPGLGPDAETAQAPAPPPSLRTETLVSAQAEVPKPLDRTDALAPPPQPAGRLPPPERLTERRPPPVPAPPPPRHAEAELLDAAELEMLDESSLPLPEVPDDVPTRVGDRPPLIHPQTTARMPSAAPPAFASPATGTTSPLGFGAVTAPIADYTPPPPVLVDVTPLTLSVETVGGYSDPLIARNNPVPCSRTREFVTAADYQTTVRVRVGQGESNRFAENTLLGELELSGLRSGLRGEVQVSVTFALDTSGMLEVSARDVQTGRVTSAHVHLVGLPEPHHVAGLAARHAAHPAG